MRTIILALLPVACALPLENAPCPCTDGWVCCPVDDVCVGVADLERDPSLCLDDGMVAVGAATFLMGSPLGEAGRDADELQHTVTLTRRFSLQAVEVTQAQYAETMGWNPSRLIDCGERCPVENVSWFDAVAFTNQRSLGRLSACYVLSQVTCVDGADVGEEYMVCQDSTRGGISSAIVELNGVSSVYDCEGFRLPTEAEWELAARAGASQATYNGDLDGASLDCQQPNGVLDSIAWFCGNAGITARPVGVLSPNELLLYDMLGNAREWCHDWAASYPSDPVTDPEGPSTGVVRIGRGASWGSPAGRLRAANRYDAGAGPGLDRTDFVGFRPARSLP